MPCNKMVIIVMHVSRLVYKTIYPFVMGSSDQGTMLLVQSVLPKRLPNDLEVFLQF